MTKKAVISIDVDDSQFKAFNELFSQFQAKLESMPDDWKKSNAAMNKTSKAMEDAKKALASSSSHAGSMASSLKKAAHSQNQLSSATRKASMDMKKLATESAKVGKSIFGIGKFLFKMGALGAGFGVAGMFGLRELAESAVSTQRTARGLGLKQGPYRAFKTDWGRYVSPSMLSSVSEAQGSYSGRMWLARSTGMSQEQIANAPVTDIAAQEAISANKWWNNTPSAQRTQQNWQASGFAQSGMSWEDMRRLGNTPMSELKTAQANYAKDAKAFSVGTSTTDAMYQFTRALTAAGQTIETLLLRKLPDLTKALSPLISTLEKDAEAFINSTLTPENIQKAINGIGDFARYLGSKETLQHIKDFGDAVVDITSLIVKTAAWLGKLTDVDSSKNPYLKNAMGDMPEIDAIMKTRGKNKSSGKINYPSLPGSARGNVGNLRSAPGVPSVHGFAQFGNKQDAIKAMAWTLEGQNYSNKTLGQMITTYAPPNENDTASYIKNVSKWSSINPNDKIDTSDPSVMTKIISAMVRQESNTRMSPDDVRNAISQSQYNVPARSGFSQLMANMRPRSIPNVNVVIKNHTAARVAVQANAAGM